MRGFRSEFVFKECRDYNYKRCFTLAGGKLVDVGRDDGCTVEEMEAGIGPKTAGVAYFESGRWGSEWVSLDQAREVVGYIPQDSAEEALVRS